MKKNDFQRLADYSEKVRNSTLKRLINIPAGKENFKVSDISMTVADIAHHLILCDKAYLALLRTRRLEKNLGKNNNIKINSRDEYDVLIKKLEELKIKRRDFILSLNNENINTKIEVDSLEGIGEEDLGSLLYRMLDHETHHRGTLAAYLNIINSK